MVSNFVFFFLKVCDRSFEVRIFPVFFHGLISFLGYFSCPGCGTEINFWLRMGCWVGGGGAVPLNFCTVLWQYGSGMVTL